MNPFALLLLFVAGGAAAALALRRPAPSEAADVATDEPSAPVVYGAPAVAAPDIFATFTAAVNDTLKKIFTVPAAGQPYADAIRAAEVKYSLPDGLLARVLYQESRFRPEIINGTKKSSAGAVGIAQFMPATARDLGVDPLDPWQAIDGAARYLRQLYNQAGSWERALAAYNWGIGNVQRKGLAAAPKETRDYVAEVMADVAA